MAEVGDLSHPEADFPASADHGQPPFTVIPGGRTGPVLPGGPRQYIGDPSIPGAFCVPQGYEVWADGLYMLQEPLEGGERDVEPSLRRTPSSHRVRCLRIVTRRPIWISRLGTAIDTGEELVQLAYFNTFNNPEPVIEWVSRSQITDRRALGGLGGRGLPMRSGNAGLVEDYLDKALAENGPTLPRVQVASRCGAYHVNLPAGGKAWGWLVGQAWIGPAEAKVESDPRAESGDTRGFIVSGDLASWCAKLNELSAVSPVCRWLCFSTFAAPLLRFISHRTFIIHHWGDSGGGKTGLARFAMSAWGHPQLLTANFNRTQLSFTELFGYIDDLPVAFDELQASKNVDHANLIYAICLERGRARARKSGGLQKEIEKWRSIVRMTGEEPIIGNGKLNLGGETRRVIQLNARVLEERDAGGLHKWLESNVNFGHAGLAFLESLRSVVNLPDGIERLVKRYEALYQALDGRLGKLQSRASALSAVALGEYLAATWLLHVDRDQAFEVAVQDALAVAKVIAADENGTESVAEQAVQAFRDHRIAYRHLWVDIQTEAGGVAVANLEYKNLFAVESGDEVWLVGAQANDLLGKKGLPSGRVWVDLRRQGWLRPGVDEGRHSDWRQHGRLKNRFYVIPKHVFDA